MSNQLLTAIVVFGLDRSSADRYVHALAVCNSLAELASSGSEAEFCDRIGTLMCLKKHWSRGHGDAKVVCGCGKDEDESVDETHWSVEIENISLHSVLSRDRVTSSQPVLVVCRKNVTNDGTTRDGTASENVHQQSERYNVFPSLLTVPASHTSKCRVCFQPKTKIVHFMVQI